MFILAAQAVARQAYLDCYILTAPLWVACGTEYGTCLAKYAIVVTVVAIVVVCS